MFGVLLIPFFDRLRVGINCGRGPLDEKASVDSGDLRLDRE